MAIKPTPAQARALRNILSAGHAHGVRVATVRALIRQDWIVGQSEARPVIGPLGVTWARCQLTDTALAHLRRLDRSLLAFRMELLENTAGSWNRNRYATGSGGRLFDLWTNQFIAAEVPAA